MSEIKVVPEEEYEEFIRIGAEAYPGMEVRTQADREKQLERFSTMRRDERWTPYGVYRDGKMVGIFRNFDFTLNVRGNLIPAGGLGYVAVDLMHKREHVAKDIVEFFVSHYDSQGAAMTTLWPFRVDFYRKMGYGLGGKTFQYRVKPEWLPRGKTKEHIRFLTGKDIPAIDECYNRMLEKRTGMIRHGEGYWENIFEFSEKLRFVGCEIDGRLEGYLVYSFKKPEHPTSFMDNDLIVSEFFYHTPEALSELLTFLHTQHDQIDRVVLHTSEEEFYFLLHNPARDSGTSMPPIYHESHLAGVGVMYRVQNTRLLFEQLSGPVFGDVTLKLKITLHDSFFPKNNGSIVVHFEGGKATLADSEGSDVEISMDVAEFSSMIMGAVGFRKLHAYGLARISDISRLDDVDKLFACAEKPICVTPF